MVNLVTEGNICRVGDANIGLTNIGAAGAGKYFSDTSTDSGAGCIGGVCTNVTSVNSVNAGEGLLGAHMHGIIIIIIIMSVFYSANFNSDKSPCSKALMISDRHQTEAGRKHTI